MKSTQKSYALSLSLAAICIFLVSQAFGQVLPDGKIRVEAKTALQQKTLAREVAKTQAASATVTIYSAAPTELLDKVIPAFEKNAKLKVILVKGGSGDLINRLKTEQGQKTADVLFSVATETIETNSILFRRSTPENMKFLSLEYMIDAFSVTDMSVPFTAVATAIGVNTNQLMPDQYPKNWSDLAKPIYKGKISLARVDKSGSAYIQLASILQIYGETKGWELYSKILENAVLFPSSGAVPKALNDGGEIAIGVANEDQLQTLKTGGSPIELIYPTDGVAATADAMALLANPPNAKGGKAFMNFMLSKEAQELVEAVGRRSIRSDLISKNGLLPLSKIKLIKYNIALASINREKNMAKWKWLAQNKIE